MSSHTHGVFGSNARVAHGRSAVLYAGAVAFARHVLPVEIVDTRADCISISTMIVRDARPGPNRGVASRAWVERRLAHARREDAPVLDALGNGLCFGVGHGGSVRREHDEFVVGEERARDAGRDAPDRGKKAVGLGSVHGRRYVRAGQKQRRV